MIRAIETFKGENHERGQETRKSKVPKIKGGWAEV